MSLYPMSEEDLANMQEHPDDYSQAGFFGGPRQGGFFLHVDPTMMHKCKYCKCIDYFTVLCDHDPGAGGCEYYIDYCCPRCHSALTHVYDNRSGLMHWE